MWQPRSFLRAVRQAALTATLVCAALLSSGAADAQPLSFWRDDAAYPTSTNRLLGQSRTDGSILLYHPTGVASGFTVNYVPKELMGWPSSFFHNADRITVRLDMDNNGSWDHQQLAPQGTLETPRAFTWNYPVPAYPSWGTPTIRWEAVQERVNVLGQWVHYRTVSGTVVAQTQDAPDITYVAGNGDKLTGFLSPDGVLDRPLVVVEGYDAKNASWPSRYFGELGPVLVSSPLLQAGYDVFVYNFNDATLGMDQNAMGVLGGIMRLNQDSNGAFPARVLGFSMGGVISRYALAWGEQNGYSHGCDMFIAGDSPQQGAWLNIGFQALLLSNQGSYPDIDELLAEFQTPAAQQLLRINLTDPVDGTNTGPEINGRATYENFYNTLNGLNGNGYPNQTTNIAFTNGHGDLSIPRLYRSAPPGIYVGSPLATLLFNLNGSYLTIPIVMEQEDLRAGSLQPAFRDPTNTGFGFHFSLFQWEALITLQLTLGVSPSAYIWANSALDLWNVQWENEDIVDWTHSKFDEIYAAQSTNFHDDVPPELAGVVVSRLLDCGDAIGVAYPVGGETHFTNQPVEVEWENCPTYAYASHTVQFSSDGGGSYTPLLTVGGGSTSATVTMPAVISNTCRIRVDSQLADGTVLQYEAPGDFEITVGLAGETPANLSGGDLHSISWPDLDNDGILDLCRIDIANTNAPVELFRGNGDGTFTPLYFSLPGWVDLSNARSIAWADYNNDGWLDCYIGRDSAPNVLFKCLGALPAPAYVEYEDATVPPLDDAGQAKGVSWVDFDNTGRMDIFVANRNSTNKLFRNAGAGSWVDDSATVAGYASEKTYCGVWADYDEDGDQDLFVTNWLGVDHLYRNNGNRTFSEVWMFPQYSYQSRSANWVDYDNDGDFDIHVVTVYGSDFLWENQGDGTFETVDRGLGGTTLEDDFTATWRDVSNFGWLDPWIVTGADDRRYVNNGFQGTPDFTFLGGLWHGDGYGRVGMAADYDNDGHMDLYFADKKNGAPINWLLHNYVVYPNTHWIEIDLVGTRKNRDAIGAVVKILGVNNGDVGTPARIVSGGNGFHSQSPLRLHFGIGNATEVDVQIRWPSGLVQAKHISTVDQIVTFTEPPVPPPPPPGCPFVYVHDGDGFVESNTVLAAVDEDLGGKNESDVEDLHVLRTAPVSNDGRYTLQIREFEREQTFLDHAELWVFEHPEGTRLVNDLDGGLFLRDEADVRPTEATYAGQDILALLEQEDGRAFHGQSGDIVELRFEAREDVGPGSFGASAIPKIPAAPNFRGRPGGIEVLGRTVSTEDYVSLGVLRPRELPSEQGMVLLPHGDNAGAGQGYTDVRLVWHTAHELDWFGWTRELGELTEPTVLRVAAAGHAVSGEPNASTGNPEARKVTNVRLDLAESDGHHSVLSPGEQIELTFDALPPAESHRSFVLYVEGHYITLPAEEIPDVVSLFEGAPNPFADRTAIGFALPTRGAANLAVYAADGRKIRSLVDGEVEAGVHEVQWDGRDDDGRTVASGTYFYRLLTKESDVTRKVMFLK